MMRRLRNRLRRSGWRALALASIALMLLLVLSGCASTQEGHDTHAGHAGGAHTDNIETTSGPEVLPSFLDDYTDTTRDFYLSVPLHADLLKELNCYCGCMEYNDPHDSLYRCFIVGIDDEGVHWTDHGSSCGICLMEVRDAVKMAEEGKSIEEIKAYIDKTYGGSESTAPTPST
ncbi:PCYCGC domain-containing protein [Paenibacillus sp. TRM 82003]|nr:PCYCGC domain-containing protein [Paenibacillus sp. TRM 82003]